MKKGNPQTRATRQYKDKLKRARGMSQMLVWNKIRKINGTYYKLYNTVFFFQVYQKFKFKTFKRQSLLLLLVIDFFKNCRISDMKLWFLNDTANLYPDLRFLKEQGYVYNQGYYYFVTLTGRKVLDDFFKEYHSGITKLNKRNYERLSKQRPIGYSSPKTKEGTGQAYLTQSNADGEHSGWDSGS